MKHQMFRRIVAGCLSALMLVMSPMSTVAGIGSNEFAVVKAGEAVATASEASPSQIVKEEAAFEQSREADGVIVTVKADPGVFPENAELSVKIVSRAKDLKKVEEAVAKEQTKNIADQYVFDISVLVNGEEVEPDTAKGTVQVSFALAEVHDENSELEVFHVTEEEDGLVAESLEVEEEIVDNEDNAKRDEETVVTVETDGFSVYVVAFTYDDLAYTFGEEREVKLTDVMESAGLAGELEEAAVNGDEALTVQKGDDSAENWLLKADKRFDEGNLTLTVNGKAYDITVTDGETNPIYWQVNPTAKTLLITKDDSVLGVAGTTSGTFDGAVQFTSYTAVPWYSSRSDYTSVIVDGSEGKVAPSFTSYWFYNNSAVTSMDLSGLDTSDVTDMYQMFMYCGDLTELDLSGFDFTNVTNAARMFNSLYDLKKLDLSNFNPQNQVDVSAMFSYCNFEELDLSGVDSSKWTAGTGTYDAPFNQVKRLVKITLGPDWDNSYPVPTPDSYYVKHADGFWHKTNGTKYQPADVDTEGETVTYYSVYYSYQISLNANGGTVKAGTPTQKTLVSPEKFELPGDSFTKPGYRLIRWKDNNNNYYDPNATVWNLASADGEVITMTAQWSLNLYTLAFDANGGKGTMAPVSYMSYESIRTLAANTFTRTGYTFAGWATTRTGSVKYKDKATVKNLPGNNNATVTLYAVWTKNKYTITYKLDGGKNSTKNPSSYYVTTSTITLQNPTKTGYTFAGWYTSSSYKTKATSIKLGSTGNKTFYAKWTANTYTIKFDANGGKGTMSSLTSRKYGTSYTLSAVKFTKSGMKFVGWNTKKDGSGTTYADKAKVSNLTATNKAAVTLYAVWGYTVTYQLNGGTNSKSNPAALKKGATFTLKNPTRTGYTFAGWYSDSKFKTKVTQIKKIAKNTTLYAKWTPVSYTVKFDKNGGKGTMASQKAKYDTNLKLRKNTFTRSGFTFGGWNTKKDGTGTAYADAASVKNLSSKSGATVTLYAQWQISAKVTLKSAAKSKYYQNSLTYTVSGSCTGVEVWRSTKSTSGFTCLGTVTDKTGCVDKAAVAGKKYYYKVRAYKTVSGKTYYGAYSAVKNVTTAAKPEFSAGLTTIYNKGVKITIKNSSKKAITIGGNAATYYGFLYPKAGYDSVMSRLSNSTFVNSLTQVSVASGKTEYAYYKYIDKTLKYSDVDVQDCHMSFYITYDGCPYRVVVYTNSDRIPYFSTPGGSEPDEDQDLTGGRILIDDMEYTPDF